MRWFLFAMLIGLAGCSTPTEPTQEELAAAWEAQNTFPQHYKTDMLAFLRTYLNDPTHLRDTQISEPVRKKVGPADRYVVCVRYNTRNSSGKYLGPKDAAAVYVGAKLDRFIDQAVEVKRVCADVAMVPFPELERLQR